MNKIWLCGLLCVMSLFGQNLRNQILCSDQKTCDVFIMDANGDWSKPESILWHWNPKDDPNIPPERKRAFGNMSDSKCVSDGKQILVVASGGGMALIDVATKQSVFTAYPGGNTHSAELLPDGTVITASSTGATLKVFTRIGDEKTPHKTFTYKFPGGHGVVWDQIHGLVWAVGADVLVAFRYNFDVENPQLIPVQTFDLGKGYSGHDLVLLKKENKLLLTGRDVKEFDTMLGTLRLFSNKHSVKSISIHPETREQLVQIPNEQWWNDTVMLLNGDRKWTLPNKARIYKTRWFSY
jgi:hypothetical protein